MLVKARKLEIPIDIQCDLFEKLVFPVLLYGCEVWGFHSIDMLEVFFKKFIKKILKLRPSTPNCMVYGEVGRLPLQVTVDKYMVNYWLRLLNKDETTIAHIMYKTVFNLFTRDEYKAQWLCRVKTILDNCGLSYMWVDQHTIDTRRCRIIIQKRIEDIAMHKWYIGMSTSSMCTMHRLFKKQLQFEKYLFISNNKERISLTKFRCSNIRIPVYNQIYLFQSELCNLCDLNLCGDEYHYLLICPFFTRDRERYLKRYYYCRPTLTKFELLLSSTNRSIASKLAKFANVILNHF